MRYRFADIVIDREAYRATRAGEELSLQPKMFELLCHLIRHRPRAVARDELLATFWPNEHVGDAVVTWTVSHIRKQLGQNGGSRLPIETVHGRGYRFMADVSEESPQPANDARPSARPLVKPPSSPFVGRAAELDRLEAALSSALAGTGKLCMIVGESGIGKTRCAEAVAELASQRGASVLTGYAIDSGPLFRPWMQVVRELARVSAASATAVARLDERLSRLTRGTEDSSPQGPAHGARFQLYEELLEVLAKAAAAQPLVVVLEDIHQADHGTIELLRFAATELAKHRLLLVTTAQDHMDGATPSVYPSGPVEKIALRQLSAEDVAAYLSGTFELQAKPPNDLVEAILRATAGIPLFVKETVDSLRSRYGPEGIETLPSGAVEPSQVARDVLKRRLAQLPEEVQSLLATASVLGRAFDLATLEIVGGVPTEAQIRLLQMADDHGLVTPDTPHRYRFTHDLHHAVLYDSVPTAARIATHRRAAKALEDQPAIEGRWAAIAYHYYRSMPAGDYAAVVDACSRAAASANAALAPADAARYYGWALEAQPFQPNLQPRDRAELLLRAVHAQRSAGRDKEARATAASMVEIARQHDFVDLLLATAKVLRPSMMASAIPDALVKRCLEDALSRLPQQDKRQRVEAAALLSGLPPYSSDLTRCQKMASKALADARALGDTRALLSALRANLYALSGPDDDRELLKVVDELITFEGEKSPDLIVDAAAAQAGAAYMRGRIDEGDAAIDRIGALCFDYKLPELEWYLLRQQAQRQYRAGNLTLCAETLQELARRGQRMGLSYAKDFCIPLHCDLHRARTGEWYTPHRRRLRRRPDTASLAHLVWRAHAAARGGDHSFARELLAQIASGGLAATPKELNYLSNLCVLATVSSLLPGHPHAEELYGLLLPYAAYNTPDLLLRYDGAVARHLGRLATVLEDMDAARAHYTAAIDLNQRLQHRPALAETYLEYASWLTTHGTATDRSARRDAAERAAAAAARANMAWVQAQAREFS